MPLLAGRFFAVRCGTYAGVLKSFQVEAGEALADDRSVGIHVVTKVESLPYHQAKADLNFRKNTLLWRGPS